MVLKKILNVLILFCPWPIRRRLLIRFWGYKIHNTARIGFSYIYPSHLEMKEGAKIDHFTFAIHLENLALGYKSTIGRSNWITGFPMNTKSLHFNHQKNRISELVVGDHSAITKNHHLDCTNKIQIGDFVTVAGYGSQLLTHSVNIFESRQDSNPITIGNYCFVGTNVVILGGSTLPNYSVLGAKSLLNKNFLTPYSLYGGTPARMIKELPKNCKYFYRKEGFII